MLQFVPDHLKTQEICDVRVERRLWSLQYVTVQFKTKEISEKADKKFPLCIGICS